MAYDLNLADRIRTTFESKKIKFKEKEMFGGVAFMVKEKMCVGVIKNDLMARIDPDQHAMFVKKPGARTMDFGGRPMKGYIYVDPKGVDSAKDLRFWVDQCLEFNPKARSSKKK